MKGTTLIEQSQRMEKRARQIIDETRLINIWQESGCEVNIVGSLATGLMMKHRDIDLHVYSKQITPQGSFAIMSRIAENRNITKIEYRNLLNTEEKCIEWHAWYNEDNKDEEWQIDIIHILKDSLYDGYFEHIAQRIKSVLDKDTRMAILRLKAEMPENEQITGIEYCQAVLRDGIRTVTELKEWLKNNHTTNIIKWVP